MALAILKLLDYDDSKLRFQIDTGTNRFYQLKAGTGVLRDNGIELVDGLYYSTPIQENQAGGDLFQSSREIAVPARHFNQQPTFVQLFSYKTNGRISPAFSRIIRVPTTAQLPAVRIPPERRYEYAASLSLDALHRATTKQYEDDTTMTSAMAAVQADRRPRRIAYRDANLSQQTSVDDLLSTILKAATPLVSQLLGSGGAGLNAGMADVLAQLLKTVLAGPSQPAAVVPAEVAKPASIGAGNRFERYGRNGYSEQMIFGIDDALLGSLVGSVAGPLLQILPQLANAANQKRVDLKKADNAMITGIVAEINKRLTANKAAEIAGQTQQQAQEAELQKLKLLLEAMQNAPATTQSLSLVQSRPERSYSFSSRATLGFDFGPTMDWNGAKQALYVRTQDIAVRVRFSVAEPIPSKPLEKAILKLVLRDSSNPSVRFEKIFKRKNVPANSVIECALQSGEIAHLPANKPLAVLAELRWIAGRNRKEVRALGSGELVLTDTYFLKDRGQAIGKELELTDMQRYRTFWNKFWEAPVMDAASGKGSVNKRLWEIDANAKYSIVLSAEHETNGVMETKTLAGPPDVDSVRLLMDGRMKGGMELSVAEINKLLPLWDGAQSLDADRLKALSGASFLQSHGGDFQYRLRMKGKKGERGLIWVVPVFKLFSLKIGAATKVDGAGQVTEVREEDVRFPIPVAARILGLRSK